MKIEEPYKYIDLFAGCGGLSLGLHKAGWNGLFAIEKSPDAFETLQFNLNSHFNWPNWLPKKNHDINEILSTKREELLSLRDKVDMVAGGPPCQGFSLAGRRIEGDSRNDLVKSYISFIELIRPKIIFFENVKGFTLGFKKGDKRGKPYSAIVLEELNKLGYNVHGELIDFSEFGVPQKRTRFILIGVRKDLTSKILDKKFFFNHIEKDKETFLKSKGLSVPVNIEQAISDLLKSNNTTESPDNKRFLAGKYSKVSSNYQKLLRDNIKIGSIADSHRFANHTQKITKRFYQIQELNLKGSEIRKRYNTKKSSIKVLNSSLPSPTITTLPDDYIHYSEPRILTVREYARIQSFPDSYKFKGKYTTGGRRRVLEVPRYSQIGNAIPPLFAEQSGLILIKLLNHVRNKRA
ncbi:DNA cytosine methyltransferase [Marinifilum flexuosum]|uniref:DNA cytosine methyltransferase n=1 Tax=Marinifilum flexuosum TaxID=1117708 RepID=UPI002494EC20|nr:DNA cytosine methyltransferase [Marinifilum flexuosum]